MGQSELVHECIQLVTQRNQQNKKKKGYIRWKQNWQLVFSCDKMRWFKMDGEILKFRHLLTWHGSSMVGAKLSSFTLLFNLFKMAGKTSRQRPPARWGRRANWWVRGMGKWYPSVRWCHKSGSSLLCVIKGYTSYVGFRHKRGYPVCGLTSWNEDTPSVGWRHKWEYPPSVGWHHEMGIPLMWDDVMKEDTPSVGWRHEEGVDRTKCNTVLWYVWRTQW